MIGKAGLIGLGLVVAVLSAENQAAYLYPWPATPTVSDPLDPGTEPSRDIRGLWYATDGAFDYFRIDLEAAPVSTNAGSSEVYGVYIDGKNGGGQNTQDVQYIPAALSGIDFIVDSHWDANGRFRQDFHVYGAYGGFFVYTTIYPHQTTENGGRTLEWAAPAFDGGIGPVFTMWGASIDIGDPSATHDITEGYQVPEPAGLLLFLASAAGLMRRRS